MLVAASAVFGLAIGSFLNVVVYRVPRGESVVKPRSHCPGCNTPIAERDNIPVLSWLLLRGRCRHCAMRISLRYPLVELGTAVLFVIAALRHPGRTWLSVPAYCVFFAGLFALSLIDLETKRLPNRVLYPTLFLGGALLIAASLSHHRLHRLADAAIGGAAAFAVLFVIHVVVPQGMAFGDVRLSGVIGVLVGWIAKAQVPVAIFLGFLLGSVVGVALIASGRSSRKSKIPFGPFLAAGAVITVVAGGPIARVVFPAR